MNRRTLTCGIAVCITLILAGCASAPSQELSILDAMQAGSSSKPLSCAALDAATFCVKSSRLDRSKDCSCVERQSVYDGRQFKF
jgi:hypothetical protein